MSAGITPGAWYVEPSNPLIVSNDDYQIARLIVKPVQGEAEENASLIAEAGTVANETGLTPRQLADQRAELLAALQKIIAADDAQRLSQREIEAGRAAVAKATGEGA